MTPPAVRLHALERGAAVVDAVPDVVEPLTLVGEVLRHRRVVTRRREELHVGVGDLEQRLLDAVALDDLAVLDRAPERVVVVGDRGLEVVDGDGDVVDLGELHRRIVPTRVGPGVPRRSVVGIGARSRASIPDLTGRLLPSTMGVVWARRLFAFPDPVNEVSARLVAGFVVILGVATVATGERWLLVPLAYGFVARVLTGPTLSPLGQFVTRVLTPRPAVRAALGAGPPKRFAQGIGATFERRRARPRVRRRTRRRRRWSSSALVVVAATLESVFALLPRLHALRRADPARRHPGAHLRAVRRSRPRRNRRARRDAVRDRAGLGALDVAQLDHEPQRLVGRDPGSLRRREPYASSDGIPSSRLPPTFMPTRPCCQPGITLTSGNVAG